MLGQLPAMQRDMLGTFERAAAHGDVVRLDFPGRTAFLLSHPDAVKRVLVDRQRNYGRDTRGYAMLRIALGEGLVTAEGETWRRHRQTAKPAFLPAAIRGFLETMDGAATRRVARWREEQPDGGPLDIAHELMGLTLEIVGRCLVSRDLSDDSGPIGEAVSVVMRETVWRITHPLALPLRVPTPRNLRLRRSLAKMHGLVAAIVAERRAHRGERREDLLDLLIDSRDEETGAGFSDRELFDEVMTMISAGHETTATALTWAFHLLGAHPEVRARAEAEVDSALGDEPATVERLAKLEYVEAVIEEAMRLYPPVWTVARSTGEDDEILGYPIPAAAVVFLPQIVLHRHPQYWARPLEFDPERFLGTRRKEVSRFVYFPFSGGPRVCIGQGFAMMEAKLILARVLRAARLDPVPGPPVKLEPMITLRPRGGLVQRLRWRPC